jgi:hypothetical protein
MSVSSTVESGYVSAARRVLTRRAVTARYAAPVLTAYLLTRLVVCTLVFVSLVVLPVRVAPSLSTHFPNLVVDGLVRWDSFHYANIALNGYDRMKTAFFPLYPLLVASLRVIVGNVYVAGLLVSNAALLVALGYVYALARREYDQTGATRTVFYLATAPGSVFFSAMYTESLFVALVAATFYHARSAQWSRAALAGGLAAATRNTGVVLAAVIALEGLHQVGVRVRPQVWCVRALWSHVRLQGRRVVHARYALAASAIVPIGLLAYMAFLGHAFHDPLAFLHAEAFWGKHVSLSNLMHILPQGHLTLANQLDILVTLTLVPLVLSVCRRMRPAYIVFTLASFLMPLDTGGTAGMTRYALMLVPCYLLLGSLVRRPGLDRLILCLSLALMTFVTVTFCHWGGPN